MTKDVREEMTDVLKDQLLQTAVVALANELVLAAAEQFVDRQLELDRKCCELERHGYQRSAAHCRSLIDQLSLTNTLASDMNAAFDSLRVSQPLRVEVPESNNPTVSEVPALPNRVQRNGSPDPERGPVPSGNGTNGAEVKPESPTPKKKRKAKAASQ